MILRSECSAAFSTVSALAVPAKAKSAASTQARRRPSMDFSLFPGRRIRPSVALRDLQERLPVRQLHARPALLGAGGDLGLVDAMPARSIDRTRHRIGPALEIAVF